jgi:outer membrane protein assembly factor BamB
MFLPILLLPVLGALIHFGSFSFGLSGGLAPLQIIPLPQGNATSNQTIVNTTTTSIPTNSTTTSINTTTTVNTTTSLNTTTSVPTTSTTSVNTTTTIPVNTTTSTTNTTSVTTSLNQPLALITLQSNILQSLGEQDWTSFTLNYSDSRYQANSTINGSNANDLVPNWFINVAQLPFTNTTQGLGVTSTPLVSNGKVYFTDWKGNVYSANIATGSINWEVSLGGNAISSTPFLDDGVLYVALGPLGPLKVYALNANTGATMWASQLNTTTKQLYASPIVYNGLVYVGVAGDVNDNETNQSSSGAIFALNAIDGDVVWHFNTRANNSIAGGDGVWGSVVVDPGLNEIYFGTGNPYCTGENGVKPLNLTCANSDSLYGYSIVSLNANTGNLVWATPIYKNYSVGQDSDFGSSANLFSYTSTSNGKTYDAVGLGNKNGNYLILDRVNGTILETFTIGSGAGIDGIRGLAGFNYISPDNPEIFVPSGTNTGHGYGTVVAIYPANDTMAWSFNTPGVMTGSVAVVPGAVFFGDENSNLYAVNSTNGNLLFHTHLKAYIDAGVTVAEGHVLVGTVFGSHVGLYAFSLNTTPANITITPLLVSLTSINATGNVILDAGQNVALTATSTANGTSSNYNFYFIPVNNTIDGCSNDIASINATGNVILDAGQNVALTATSTANGTSSNYNFYFIPVNNTIDGCSNDIVTGGRSATCTFPASAGPNPIGYEAYTYGANVMSGSHTASSNPINVRVYGDINNSNGNVPLLTLTPSNTVLSTNQVETFTLTEKGGVGPFNVELYNETGSKIQDSLVMGSPGESNTLSFVASRSGTFKFYGIATDVGTTAPFVFNSTVTTISVNTLVAGPISASQTSITVGQNVILTSNTSGGTPPYDIHWFSSTSNTEQLTWNSFNPAYEGTLLDSMESGWVKFNPNATQYSTYTDRAPGNYVEGAGSTAIVINRTTEAAIVIKQITPINLSNATNFYFWVLIPNASLVQTANTAIELDFISNSNNSDQSSCTFVGGSLRNGWNPLVINKSECLESIADGVTNAANWSRISYITFKVYPQSTNSVFQVNFDNLRYNYQGGIPHKAVVMINFDDGYANVSNVAYPVLQADNLTATAFVLTGLLNDSSICSMTNGTYTPCSDYMTVNALHMLYNSGWDIASHTVDHPRPPGLTNSVH